MSGWFAYFTLCASVGTFGVLAFLPVKPIGTGYFRTVGIIALGLAGVTLASGGVTIPGPTQAGETFFVHVPFIKFPWFWAVPAIVYGVVLLVHPWLFGVPSQNLWKLTIGIGCVLGVFLLATLQLVLWGLEWDLGVLWLDGLVMLVSGMVLGLATDAMLLGHWYLNVPNLSFTYLKRASLALVAAIGVRLLLSLMMLGQHGTGAAGEDPLTKLAPIARVAVGEVVALILAFLAWRCAKIHSNQSATGILYVVLFCVIVGEMIGAYLLGTTGLPL